MRAVLKSLMYGVCVATLTAGLWGCDEDEIRAYQAPKEPAALRPPQPSPQELLRAATEGTPKRDTGVGTGSSPGQDRQHTGIQWVVPSHWREDPNASSILYAAFLVDSAQGPARVTVTVLPGSAGGVLANVNRWRGQMNLEPVAQLEDETVTTLIVADQPVMMVDLAQPGGDNPNRMLAVILPWEGRTWFFKMTGTSQPVEDQKQAFIQFVQSVRMD